MRDVFKSDGRTILFVVHSKQTVNNLCDKVLWLNTGKLKEYGEVTSIVSKDVTGVQQYKLKQGWDFPEEAPRIKFVRIESVELVPHVLDADTPLDILTPLR